MKQHKWHKEIKAWADGAEIEYRIRKPNEPWSDWDLVVEPTWHLNTWQEIEYRIKPQPKEKLINALGIVADYFYDGKVRNLLVVDACEKAINQETGKDMYVTSIVEEPKEPQYLYVYRSPIIDGLSDSKATLARVKIDSDLYIGKIKLETENE